LKKASLQASKPDMEEAWADLLADLDEQMPQKRKKRPFIYMMPILLCLTAMGSLVLLKPSPALTSSRSVIKTEEPIHVGKGQGSLPPAGISSKVPHTPGTSQHILQAQEGNRIFPSQPSRNIHTQQTSGALKRYADPALLGKAPGSSSRIALEDLIFLADADSYDWLAPHYGKSISFSTFENLQTDIADYIPSPEDMDNLLTQKPDTAKEEKNNTKDLVPVRKKRNFSIGGSLSYNFNNFTLNETRNSNKLINGAYQAYKQIGINAYCRIPLSHVWQVQPELGLEPQSTRIQINYRTEGLSTFTRYQVNRMLYTHLGFSGYFEVQRDVYLIGGVYCAYALPHYGARMEQINQEPGKDPVVLSSNYEHRDFRRNVFGLNRNDYGVLGGIEWHKGRLSSAVRFYRGLTDVTPETPTNYHNFNISLRFGYHLEFSKQ